MSDEPRVIDLSGPQAEPPPDLDVDDANDLQGFHFRRLMRKPITWVLAGILALAGGIAGAIVLAPVLGMAIAAGVGVLAVIVVFFLADSQAESAFFQIYSQQRGMRMTGASDLPAATPLLKKGDERKAEQVMAGPIADGVDGTVALYTYTDVYYDKNGRHENNYTYTVVMSPVTETTGLCPLLLCNRKFGFKALEGFEDFFRKNERVKLESLDLDERFEIFCGDSQDQNWIRQLFSPTFIVWLTENTPEKFAFELVNGTLCCNVKGHKKSAKDLDEMRAATAGVAQRLREEAAEGGPA